MAGILFFVAVRKRIQLGVMEQAVVPIAPGKFLGANVQVLVFLELRSVEMSMVLLLGQVRVQSAQADSREGHEIRQVLPHLLGGEMSTIMTLSLLESGR